MTQDTFEHITTKQLVSGGEQKVAGTVGRWSFFQAKTNVTLGGWYNASKSYLDLDSTGAVTGLGSAHVMELKMPLTPPSGGHYTVAEHELVFQASTTGGRDVSMMWFQVSGDATAITHWEDNGFFFELTGMSAGDAKIFSLNAGLTKKGALRINIDGVPYYIMLASSPTS